MEIFLDFETYFDSKDYTLKKLSMEQYVRDPRFEATLLSVAIDEGPVRVFEGQDIGRVLEALPLDNPQVFTYAQNGKFDFLIINEHYHKQVATPICTRGMARWVGMARISRESQAAMCEFFGTGIKGTFLDSMSGRHLRDLSPAELKAYKDYCVSDTEDMRKNIRIMQPHMSADAYAFIAMTTRMFGHPRIVLNKALLRSYYDKLEAKHQAAQDRIQHLFQFPTNEAFLKAVRSKSKFVEMLEHLGGVCPIKKSVKRTATALMKLDERIAQAAVGSDAYCQLVGQRANREYEVWDYALAKGDLEFIELQNHENPDIAALATIRAENNSSQAMSRCSTFLDISTRGTMPVELEAFAAWTGRYRAGSEDPDAKSMKSNLQNLSKRSGDVTLRTSLTAPVGQKFVAGDSAQIECRTGAWLAGELDLLTGFAEKRDVYSELASDISGIPYETIKYWTREGADKEDYEQYFIHKVWRNVGKEGILSSQYGIGYKKYGLRLLQQGIRLKHYRPDGTVDDSDEGHYEEAKKANTVYRTKYARITKFWDTCTKVIEAMIRGDSGYFGGPNGDTLFFDGTHQVFGRRVPGIRFPDGLWLLYPELQLGWKNTTDFKPCTDEEKARGSADQKYERAYIYRQKKGAGSKWVNIYGGLLFNNINQGFSFCILRWQAINIDRVAPVVLNVHDEWVSLVPEQREQEAMAAYNYWLRQTPEWARGVPLDCSVASGYNYGEIK